MAEARCEACFAARGYDFAYAARVFLDPDRIVERNARFDHGEVRYRVLGRIVGRALVVVFAPRRGRLRLVSARKANAKEVARHGRSATEA